MAVSKVRVYSASEERGAVPIGAVDENAGDPCFEVLGILQGVIILVGTVCRLLHHVQSILFVFDVDVRHTVQAAFVLSELLCECIPILFLMFDHCFTSRLAGFCILDDGAWNLASILRKYY